MRAAEMGADVYLIEASDWIGGQLTSQGVCTPDENRWIELGGGTASYRAFRERVRQHYRQYRLSATGASQEYINPGSCWVSRISMEPKVAQVILEDALDDLPTLTVLKGMEVTEVESRVNTITSIVALDRDGVETRFCASYFLDATELGDLLPLAGVEHVVGAESQAETNEPDAPRTSRPDWIQPITFPFALELRPAGEDHTIPKPDRYEEMKTLQKYHILDGAMKGMFGDLGWWTYRRVIAAENFDDPAFPCDIATINTGSNDFKGGIIPTGSSENDAETLLRARLASLGYVHWLQTECPREDDPTRKGYPEFKLRDDIFDSADGIAPSPYVRESRRIKALKTVVEQEIVARDGEGNVRQPGPRAAFVADSCGIGQYWLDIHEGGTDEPNRFLETEPFQIPLGSLIPVRVTNLLPACKNLGVTHLTNGAFRLHPIEWNVGESAGALAAFCAHHMVLPRHVLESPDILRGFQESLMEAGIPIYWWGDLPAEHPAFRAAQRLAMDGLWPSGDCVLFRPEETLTDAERGEIENLAGRALPWPANLETRSDAATWLADHLEQ